MLVIILMYSLLQNCEGTNYPNLLINISVGECTFDVPISCVSVFLCLFHTSVLSLPLSYFSVKDGARRLISYNLSPIPPALLCAQWKINNFC